MSEEGEGERQLDSVSTLLIEALRSAFPIGRLAIVGYIGYQQFATFVNKLNALATPTELNSGSIFS